MRLAPFVLVMLASILAGYAALAAFPHDPYIRYQSFKGTIFGRLTWIYDRIHHDVAPIDVVVLGSSRSGAAVVPPLLEEALAARCGRPIKVANFALPASGMDIRLTLLDELLETKRPRLVVFDTVERLPRDGHQAFADLARTSEVLGSPLLINRNLPSNLIRLPVRQVQLAAATLAPTAFGYTGSFIPENYAGTTIRIEPADILDNYRLPRADMTPQEHAALLDADSARRLAGLTPPLFGGSIAPLEFGVSRHYVRAVHDRARASGARFAILFFPFYKGPAAPLDRDWLEGVAPVWSVPGVSGDPANYIDTAHLGRKPQAQVQAWLADRIAGELGCKAG
ncbi:hypothetical protein [Polymorphobacter multimanifer]|uniref:SGNH/GDSL hydrolase family protein n=1 Tax=Polymorphobacter multimanifer TaxID=1070431 RepID=A0A841LAM1_9SPHN|nr:hypothetical protein [Polymorphobacter multimanifer]MBB6226865.1 hypothetical protein [Polymorphobacter multimanifer]